MPLGGNLFIGRSAELRTSLDLLAGADEGVVQDIVGVHGIGKSVFLERLADKAHQLDRVQVFAVDMKRYGLGEGFHNDFGNKASSAVLWETFSRSRELMLLLANRPSREFDTFRQAAHYQSRQADKYLAMNDITLGRGSRIEKADITSVVQVSDEEVKQRIREAQSEIDEAFINAWEEFTIRRRVLITVDSFELVADDEMGWWMTRLAMRLRNTLTVFARVPVTEAPRTLSSRFQRVFLQNFSCDEVVDYLDQRFRHDRLQRGMAEIVHAFTDGHPGGVTLVADFIAENGASPLEPGRLRRILERVPTDPTQRWAELVNLILVAVDEPQLRRAVDAAAVTMTFTAELLGELIEAGGHPAQDIGDTISKLLGLRLLQQVPTISGEPSGRFRLHEFIRLSIAARLQTLYRQERWVPLHRAAAQHCFRLLERWEDEGDDSYGSWYRFEQPEWQEYKRDWLRHSGMQGEHREITRARFTLVFLEAFWWWGCYLPFPFNRRLLEDWSRAATAYAEQPSVSKPTSLARHGNEDGQLTAALTYLLDNYPVGYLKPPSAPWDGIRDKLLLVRRLCGLRQGIAGTTDEERQELKRTGAFITIFLAHTRRLNDPGDPNAERYYQEAITALTELGDQWTTAWLLRERADLALERSDVADAVHYLAKAAASARALALRTVEWDHELLANLHRTMADVLWAKNELAEAATEYGRAVAHAYWFQGEPHAPDEYTQQFYSEMTTRAADRLVALHDGIVDVEQVVDVEPDVEQFVNAVLRETPGDPRESSAEAMLGRDLTAVRDQLFLRGPTTEELHLEDSAFMTQWNVLYEDHADPLIGLDYLEAAGDAVTPRG